jgi:glycosyltransferase involved in cell wall biosynthesis
MKTGLQIGLYSPFMSDNIGGGERYLLTVADCLLKSNQKVDLILQSDSTITDKEKLELKNKFIQNFNLDLQDLNIINGPFGLNSSMLDRIKFTKEYDAFYYMTDGSFFIPAAKRNIIHFMIPFKRPTGSYFNQLKLMFWPIKVANAYFTKNIMEKNWGIKFNYVHWGAIDSGKFDTQNEKKNIILNVGRFFTSSGGRHCKRQDFLVKVFKKMCDQGLKNWKLVLVGAIDKGEDNLEYAQKIAQEAKGYPIEIKHGIPFNELRQIYGKSKIYWHATGYGLDEFQNPEAMEHLGLTTVEAMAAGIVPVVIKKAGQREIVTDNDNGLFWETEKELIEKTQYLINNQKIWLKFSANAVERSKEFSKDNFCKMTMKIMGLS